MAALAAMLKERRYRVTGSDQSVYPPMSDFLAQAGIAVMQGYRAENLSPAPDLVIVGNVVSRMNPEVAALLASGIPYVSFPQALGHFFLEGKRSLVVAGTHGKTTSTALLAWVLEKAGRQPGLFVGGLSKNFGRGYQLGAGEFFAIEGDEYDTAFFDKGPKFLHYRPQAVLLNAVEFDHADIYQDLDHVKSAFQRLLDIVPTGAPILVCSDFPAAIEVAHTAGKPFATFGFSEQSHWQVRDSIDDGVLFLYRRLESQGAWPFLNPVDGTHERAQRARCLRLCLMVGLSPAKLPPGSTCLALSAVKKLWGGEGVTLLMTLRTTPQRSLSPLKPCVCVIPDAAYGRSLNHARTPVAVVSSRAFDRRASAR
jgi:UDP-N-acetylmuramate: L-alanyl-gamma-D-glutamyl-meso-diaminopimelate ligase